MGFVIFAPLLAARAQFGQVPRYHILFRTNQLTSFDAHVHLHPVFNSPSMLLAPCQTAMKQLIPSSDYVSLPKEILNAILGKWVTE